MANDIEWLYRKTERGVWVRCGLDFTEWRLLVEYVARVEYSAEGYRYYGIDGVCLESGSLLEEDTSVYRGWIGVGELMFDDVEMEGSALSERLSVLRGLATHVLELYARGYEASCVELLEMFRAPQEMLWISEREEYVCEGIDVDDFRVEGCRLRLLERAEGGGVFWVEPVGGIGFESFIDWATALTSLTFKHH